MNSRERKRQLIIEDRIQEYGPPELCHAAIGKSYAGILSAWLQQDVPDVPAHVVALMMNSFKCIRAAMPFKCKIDTYDDGANYMDFARDFDKRVTPKKAQKVDSK